MGEGEGIWFAERVDGSQKGLRVLWLIDEDILYDGGAYLCIHDLAHCEIRFRSSRLRVEEYGGPHEIEWRW
jgi:hypothetical protein